MACFLVTTAAAIGVGTAKYVVRHFEKKNIDLKPQDEDELPMSKKLGYLELTLWGGSFLLAGEHYIHGEVSFKFPFLTAAGEGEEAVSEMLTEMGTVGVGMLVLLVAAWFAGLFIAKAIRNRKKKLVSVEK
jgi:hypothetical protein